MIRIIITLIVIIFQAGTLQASSQKRKPKVTNEKIETLSIKEQAKKEIHTLPIDRNKNTTTPSVDSVLSFRDPKKEIITRTWKYYLSASIQNFKPQGKASTASGLSYDLNNYDQIILPQVSLGVIGHLSENLTFDFSGQFAFFSHAQPIKLPSGFAVEDSRTNTMITSAKLGIGTPLPSDFHLSAGLITGLFNLTQTSSNAFAQFSKNNQFTGFYSQVSYQLTQNWQTGLEYHQLKSQNNAEVTLPSDNLKFNTKVLW